MVHAARWSRGGSTLRNCDGTGAVDVAVLPCRCSMAPWFVSCVGISHAGETKMSKIVLKMTGVACDVGCLCDNCRASCKSVHTVLQFHFCVRRAWVRARVSAARCTRKPADLASNARNCSAVPG